MEICLSEDLNESENEKVINVTPSQSPTEICSNVRLIPLEAEESPLMFSRCSSLGSFSDSELQLVHDDISSNMSDVSYRTSEVVSPSEIPDSPAQYTPKTNKTRIIVIKKFNECQKNLRYESNETDRSILKKSIFEDDLSIFKEESTPVKLQSVNASSLSSLTIDDEDDVGEIKYGQVIKKFEPFEDNTYFSADEEKVLDECIRKGIEKVTGKNIDNIANTSGSASRHNDSEDWLGDGKDEAFELSNEEEALLDECIRRGIAKVTGQKLNNVESFSLKLKRYENLEKHNQNEMEKK